MQTIALRLTANYQAIAASIHHSLQWFMRDARHYQMLFLTTFLTYGTVFLKWEMDPVSMAAAFAGCLITQYLFIALGMNDLHSLKSAMISALSLCLLLKTNDPAVMLLAATLSISGKFLLRWRHPAIGSRAGGWKHFFNPTNFGIVTSIAITGNAWISPGQWGSDGLLLFGIGLLGLFVLLKVKRLDIAITFFAVFCLLTFIRNIAVLGWSADVFFHQFTSGTLLLFTFFMITDPVSTPSHRVARICWAVLVAFLAFYLATYEFINGAPIWALFFLSPLSVLFDKLFLHAKFSWI